MTFAEARQTLRVEKILSDHGVRKKGGKWLCPFHEDHHPSLVVRKRERGDTWRCYGCGAFGDAIDLKAKLEGKSVAEIVKELGIDTRPVPRRGKPIEKKPWRDAVGALEKAEDHQAVAASVIAFLKILEEK